MRTRHQRGSILEKSGSFYLRVYKDVGGTRKQVAVFLAKKDLKHHSKTCKPVRTLADDELRKANSGEAGEEQPQTTVKQFWADTYEPWIERHKRPSTVSSYKDLWARHVEPSLGATPIARVRTPDVSKMLTKFAEGGLGRNSLAHVRSLASGVFSHAVNLGLIPHNPVRDAKVLAKVEAPQPTEFFTREEVERVMDALEGMPMERCAVSLCFWAGLRPSECAALKWTDINLDGEEPSVTVERGFVRGEVGDLKTPESRGKVPLVPQCASVVRTWREKTEGDGWVFENAAGGPSSVREMARRTIKPRLAQKKIEWKSWYALRRGLATLLARVRGPLAASQALRHRNMSVTMSNYVRQDKRELEAAMRAVAEETTAKDEQE
jgi:integrase